MASRKDAKAQTKAQKKYFLGGLAPWREKVL